MYWKLKFTTVFFLLTMVFCAFGADSDKERDAILERDKQWAAAVAEGRDVDLIVSFWTDDATVFPPGAPAVAGKEAIRRFVQQSLSTPGFSMGWDTANVIVSKDGTLAYATGTNHSTFNDPEGKLITVVGKGVTVWRKEPSGVWKCVIDIWNEQPATGK